MELGCVSSAPRTVEEIFKDCSGRSAGIVRALTHDANEFYAQCDPDKENMCLYGHSNDTWEVNLPAEEVPPELPEPALGINFARDGINRRDWLSISSPCTVTRGSCRSRSVYLGARLNRNERKRLFSMINGLPTVFEVVSDRRQSKEKFGMGSANRSKLSNKRTSDGQIKSKPKPADEGYGEDDDDEHSQTLCRTCDRSYSADEF